MKGFVSSAARHGFEGAVITILFLDYDGVLHPDSAYLMRGGPVLRGDGELFMWVDLLVAALADYPKVQIVLSTSWVRMLGFRRARDFLPESLRERVIGGTFHSAMKRIDEGQWAAYYSNRTWWDSATRYQQIKRWATLSNIDDWIAIDDDIEGWLPTDNHRLIATDPDVGITGAGVLKRLHELLDRPNEINEK